MSMFSSQKQTKPDQISNDLSPSHMLVSLFQEKKEKKSFSYLIEETDVNQARSSVGRIQYILLCCIWLCEARSILIWISEYFKWTLWINSITIWIYLIWNPIVCSPVFLSVWLLWIAIGNERFTCPILKFKMMWKRRLSTIWNELTLKIKHYIV